MLWPVFDHLLADVIVTKLGVRTKLIVLELHQNQPTYWGGIFKALECLLTNESTGRMQQKPKCHTALTDKLVVFQRKNF